jgi:hypothetical protein
MPDAFASAGVDLSEDAWVTAFADESARCGGDASVHTAHSWLVAALAEIIPEVRGALGVVVEVLTNPAMWVQLPNGNDGLPADEGVFYTITASEAQNLLFMPWFRVCSAFLAPISRSRPMPRWEVQVREILGGGEESPRHPLHSRKLVLSAATPRLS